MNDTHLAWIENFAINKYLQVVYRLVALDPAIPKRIHRLLDPSGSEEVRGWGFLSARFFIQNLHTRDLTECEVGARKSTLGLNPHFGCRGYHSQTAGLWWGIKAGNHLNLHSPPLTPNQVCHQHSSHTPNVDSSFACLFAGRCPS